MTADCFIDTNVLLYSVDEDPSAAEKRRLAQELLLTKRWAWSVQVATEFYVNATSPKRQFRLKCEDASALLEAWFACPIITLTPDLIRAAIGIHQRFQLSYWDAAILAAAKQMGCGTVYSEDLSSGQVYDGVTVINPFASVVS